MQRTSELRQLTGLRFFAAIHVVLYHNLGLVGDSMKYLPPWIVSICSAGESAVSFFFLLSGFILTYVYTNNHENIKTSYAKYLLARLSRIYPIYVLAFLLDFPRGLSYFLATYDQKIAFIKISLSASAHVSMLQSWYPRLTPAWNFPAWSISTELFFYVVFPFLLPLVFKLKKDLTSLMILWLTPVALFFVFTSGFNFNLTSGPGAVMWRSFPALRITEFLIGMIIGKIFLQKQSKLYCWVGEHQKLCGFLFWCSLFISLYLVSIGIKLPATLITNLLLVPVFALMILLLAMVKIPFSTIFENNFIVLLGSASYALYIIHMPILYYINGLFQTLNLVHGFAFLGTYIVILVLASISLYKFFELPVQERLRN